jgi:glycosyltransferase involved in cell wall biosynthesis
VGPGDIVIAKTDPPMLSAALGSLAAKRGARFVAWLQDVFPEVAREYGIPGMGWPIGSTLKRLRDRSLARADAVVAIGELMAERIGRIPGVDGKRVHVIHNWADGEAIVPVDLETDPLRMQWDLAGKFAVGYSGNLGRVHEFDTLLGAASRLKDDPGVAFVIVGRGPRLAEVQARVRRDELTNVRFEPHQPRDKLAQSLGAVDVHLCVLQPGFEGLVHPSKLYGILAAGRPVIVVGDPKGEAAHIVARSGCGLSVATGDPAALVSAIGDLRRDPAKCKAMGQAARRAFETGYSMTNAFREWEELVGVL